MSDVNPMLTCREVIDLLDDDLDGVLPVGQELKLKLHLFLCRSCRRFLRTYRRTVGIVRRLRTVDEQFDGSLLPEGLVERILSRRAAKQGGSSVLTRPTTLNDE